METITVHDKEFNVEKRGKEWQTNYRDAKATTGHTKREAIGSLMEMDKIKVLEGCDSHDKTVARDVFFKEHTAQFQTTFGFTPPRDFLMYAVGYGLCLDVIALDKKLRTPDGMSTNDYILKTYGQESLDMVERMI